MRPMTALSDQDDVRPGSDRAFGLVFAAFFAIVGLWPLVGAGTPRWWALAVSVAFAVVAIVRAALLAPLNLLWFRLGLLLHRVVTPLVMGAVFFLAVTPVALLMRALGKDPLRRARTDASSYWIARDPPGPVAGSLKDQF